MVIYKILRITYYDMHLKDYGVESLKYKKLIVAHYPVHDGTYQWSKKDGYLGYRQVRAILQTFRLKFLELAELFNEVLYHICLIRR